MSELWLRKVRTYFRCVDLDKDGLISKRDFQLMAEHVCSAKKVDSVKQEKLRRMSGDVWLKFKDSPVTGENGVLTETMLIDSLKKQRNDPKLKAAIQETTRSFFEALDTDEDGYLQLVEFRRAFENCGQPDTSFAEQVFKAMDTNDDGKISFDEYVQALLEFFASEDEDCPFNLWFGPLV